MDTDLQIQERLDGLRVDFMPSHHLSLRVVERSKFDKYGPTFVQIHAALCFPVISVTTGEPTTLTAGEDRWFVHCFDDKEIALWIERLWIGAYTHEIHEWLKVNGEYVTDPHPELHTGDIPESS